MSQFVVVNNDNAYATSVYVCESEEKMLEYVQRFDIDCLDVYEIASKIELQRRTAIIMKETP